MDSLAPDAPVAEARAQLLEKALRSAQIESALRGTPNRSKVETSR